MVWYTIKPDPEVLSNLMQALQVKGVKVVELCSSSLPYIKLVRPIYGLIVFSEWHERERHESLVIKDPVPKLFFPRQVSMFPKICQRDLLPIYLISYNLQVNMNACATDAILSILMNSPKAVIGNQLYLLKVLNDHTLELNGHTTSSTEIIQEIHNGFANANEETAYNYVSYMPVNGVLYELDGQKPGPVSHGECTGGQKDEAWLKKVLPVFTEQLSRYQRNGIRIYPMAIVKNNLVLYKTKLDKLKKRFDELSFGREKKKIHYRIAHVEMKLNLAEWRFCLYMTGNEVFKHDYRPFVVNLLKLLAENKQLEPLIERAKQKRNSEDFRSQKQQKLDS